MKKTFNTARFHHFVLLPSVLFKQEDFGPNAGKMIPALGSISFRDYTDKAGVFGNTGVAVQYVISKDDRGRDRGKFFTLNQQNNALKVNDTDTDVHGKSMYDFIANHPWCEGSPNGDYVKDENGDLMQLNVKYRLMDSEADAEVALEAATRKAKAQISASEIDERTLSEVAAVGIGVRGAPDKLMRHKVVDWAGRRPVDYFEVLNAEDRPLRALIRNGISTNILQEKGTLIYWGNQILGSSEDLAVKYLLENKDALDALKEAIGFKTTIEEPKKPGRPKSK